MKKIALFILVGVLTIQASQVSAQKKGFSLGIEGGPGVRTLYGDGVADINSTTGYAVGLTAQYSFSETFALRTGLSYELKGALDKDVKFTDNSGNEVGMGDINYNLKYLTLPLMFRATISMDNFSVFGNAGLFGACLLEEQVEADGDFDMQDESGGQSGNYTDFDMGSALGLGGMLTINDMFNISLEVRNYLGFVDINNSQYSDQIKTMSTMLLIGFSHNFGKKEEAKPKE